MTVHSMLYANDDNGGRVLAAPGATANCPTCDAKMVAKCGRIKVWHWAHRSLTDCDTWSEGETIWHAAWKSRFADSEVTIRKTIAGAAEIHRADAVSPTGVVIEFQHSTISSSDILGREAFYGRMVWVLDATSPFRGDRILLRHEHPESGVPFCKFFWQHRRTSFDEASAPLFLDIGVAFRDVGDRFYKPFAWWDDADGGLRDGIRRKPGFWHRVEVAPMLIEVKKMADGAGWGRAVTHAEFCRRFGGNHRGDCQPQRAIRLVQGACPGGVERNWPPLNGLGCYSIFSTTMGDVAFGSQYGWCEMELQKGVVA